MTVENPILPPASSKSYGLMAAVQADARLAERSEGDTVFAFPIVAVLETLLALGTTLAVLVLSLVRDAPLEELANPAVTTNPAKAPWYFLGLQELLEHMHPTLAGIVLPGILVTFLFILPYLDHDRSGSGRWFTSARGRRISGLTALYALIVMPILVVLDTVINPRDALRGFAPEWIAQWLIPLAVLGLVVVLPALLMQRRVRPTPRELLLMLFTGMMVSAFVLTIIGFFFRGPGFALYWPWDMPGGYNPLDSL
jgi:menaquinol-cytochrome c reductase cytochrome b/c subunit